MMMKRTLLALAVLCVSCTFAMAPKHRFVRQSEPSKVCAPQTPCSWAVYRLPSKIVYANVENSYCRCHADMDCVLDTDDATASSYIYKCKVKET